MAQRQVLIKNITKIRDWTTCRDEQSSNRNLQLSCLMRIADTIELISKNIKSIKKKK